MLPALSSPSSDSDVPMPLSNSQREGASIAQLYVAEESSSIEEVSGEKVWHLRGAVRSRDLARVGFYYVGIRAYDHVRCVFC